MLLNRRSGSPRGGSATNWAIGRARIVGLGGAGAGAHGVAAKFASIGGDYERALQLARAGIAGATPTDGTGSVSAGR